jgi:hypothetical protein
VQAGISKLICSDAAMASLDRKVTGDSNMLTPQEYAQKREALEEIAHLGFITDLQFLPDGVDAYTDGPARLLPVRVPEGSVLAERDAVYFTCIPKLWRLTDDNNDGRADSHEAVAGDFGVRVSFIGHDLHGIVRGPDGKLYFSVGDRSYDVKTADGQVLRGDGRGAVFRCNADGSGLERHADGLRNPQEIAHIRCSGHDQIRKNQICDAAAAKVEDGLVGIGEGDGLVPELPQKALDMLPHTGLILHQHHGLVLAKRFNRQSGNFHRLPAIRMRKQQGNTRAFSRRGIDQQLTAGLRHEAERHAEAKADTLPDRLSREEGFQAPPQRLAVHAGACVGHCQRDETAALLFHVVRTERHFPAIRHREPGIDGQVEGDQLKLGRIALDLCGK